MLNSLSFSNWSLHKTLSSVSDSITKAQIHIFYFVLVMNYIKIGIFIPDFIVHVNTDQLVGTGVGFLINTVFLKLLLSRPDFLKKLIHFAQIGSLYYVWSTTLLYNQRDDIVVLQNVFMAIMFSFYGLGRNWGIVYSTLSILPVFLFSLLKWKVDGTIGDDAYTLEYITIVFVNFAVILASHFYYHDAIYGTIEEKKILNEQLEKSIQAKSNFLSTMSHELRTPLNSVIGMADLLLDDKPNEDQKENLDVLKFSAESLLTLINDILDFNKIDSAKIELESIAFNLADLLESACAGLRIKAWEKNLTFDLAIDPDLTRQGVVGDPTRFVQIVYNLVGNAIKFTQKGGVEISARVIGKQEGFIRVLFSITDTGIGISPEKLQLIFEPFTQASHNITREFGGTGLGLAIVKHLLALHGSSIHLESKENRGTRFYFNINYKTTKSVRTRDPYEPVSEKISLDNLRILVAEDNPMSVIFMKKLLSKWKADYAIVGDGQQVLEMITRNTYDVILMDMHMPVMNGYEATSLIRQMSDRLKSATPIIALTASVSDKTVSKFKEHGMTDYLSKPFRPDELHYRLAKIQTAKG